MAPLTKLTVLTGLALQLCSFAFVADPVRAERSSEVDVLTKRVVSPDGKHFAFIRSTNKTVETGIGDVPADIVFYGDTATNKLQPLFKPGAVVDTRQRLGKVPIGGLSDLTFSDNGQKLFFLTSCYATSSALIEVDLKAHQLRYVTDSNSLEAIRSGKHKGYLLITRHRYRSEKEGYGSYEQPDYVKQ